MLASLMVFPLMMIGGSFFPFEAMPAWMAAVGRWTPNGQAVARLKDILDGSARRGHARRGEPLAMIAARRRLALFAARRIRRRFARGVMFRGSGFIARRGSPDHAPPAGDHPLGLRHADRVLLFHRHDHRRAANPADRPSGRTRWSSWRPNMAGCVVDELAAQLERRTSPSRGAHRRTRPRRRARAPPARAGPVPRGEFTDAVLAASVQNRSRTGRGRRARPRGSSACAWPGRCTACSRTWR